MTKRMARPKTGRKTYPHSLALTTEQIEFLHRLPNASDYVRRLIDGIMASWDSIEEGFPILAAKAELEELEGRFGELEKEKTTYYWKHYDEAYGDEGGKRADKQTPEAEYHRRINGAYDKKLDATRAKIEEIKRKMLGELS